MSDTDRRFHEAWLGLVQPSEGLVVSVPVLLDAQCAARASPAIQERFAALTAAAPSKTSRQTELGTPSIKDFSAFLAEVLDLTPDLFDSGDALPRDLALYVPEGGQTLRPALALKRRRAPQEEAFGPNNDGTPQSHAGVGYEMLVWDLAPHLGLPLDKPEALTGPWEYPPAAKFDRLLRACRVPIGLITNRDVVRLVYAPHGESSGSIDFRIADMGGVDGRPILDAFVMLLSAARFFAVAEDVQLPELLRQSRLRQANVTNALATQVLEAVGHLLSGFEAAAERDKSPLLREAVERGGDYLYGALLTVLLRLVFLLYAEDRGLLPIEDPFYEGHLSILTLFADLQADQGTYPDSMSRRFGAWPRLIALFRAVFLGVRRGDLVMPPRRGQLFDPECFPFLEGWGPAGAAPILDAEARAQVRVPTVDDGTIFQVLKGLLYLEGQRLSYRALDVEQMGSVYEALMGYHVERLSSPAVCVRLKKTRLWVAAADVLAQPPASRSTWLVDERGLEKTDAKKVDGALRAARSEEDVLAALEPLQVRHTGRLNAGRLVLEPGVERRRTSSHYTPRSLSGPIVQRTLEPLLAAIGSAPTSTQILGLKVCDPAMGSGAFLVEACRYLGDQLVAAWTREGHHEKVGSVHEDVVMRARRLVAQRCLYGVDKNPFAVQLAKLSMWLVTLAKDEPFTFLDHALRHGDSLVGLDRQQIAGFHWRREPQLDLCHRELSMALKKALEKRLEILSLAERPGGEAVREKEHLLEEAEHALIPPRLLADLVVGAFFAGETDKGRKQERGRRLDLALAWLRAGGAPPAELLEAQRYFRARVPAFHWWLEFPEVFGGSTKGMDAFVGNPPFLGGRRISGTYGDEYADWLERGFDASKNADLSAFFLRRSFQLLRPGGMFGLIATNTIAQGDTRVAGLEPIVKAGGTIFDATRSLPWPGEASVAVAVVHVSKGDLPPKISERALDGHQVDMVNSRLRARSELSNPRPLRANADLSYQGSIVVGAGFILTPLERIELIGRDSRNGERIFPYLGGEEVNQNPRQAFDRYVIDFADLSLPEAARWPDLLAILEDKVRPERAKVKRDAHRERWWQFGDRRPGLYEALRPLKRCLVNSRVTKHLMFAWQPTGRVFAESLYAYAFEDAARFAVLQSRVHERWARLLSSSMRNDLRYAASDCFDTFPFPPVDSLRTDGGLETIGEQLDAARNACMDESIGLTETYNRLKDPAARDPHLLELRTLHEELDRVVLAAYGWSDIPLTSYLPPATPTEQKAFEVFEDEVLDRLFALNAERAEEERLKGAGDGKKKGARRKKTAAPPTAQLALGIEGDD